jgi:hypothetical protein
VLSGLQVGTTPGNAADIVNKLLANQTLFQLGFALGLISIACYVAVTGLFYLMFRLVSPSLSLIAALLSLMGQAVGAVGSLFQLGPFVLLSGSPYLSAFDVKPLQALALVFLNLSAQVDIPASAAWRVGGGGGFVLASFSLPAARGLPDDRHRDRRHSRGGRVNAVASRDRCEQRTMERTGWRGRDPHPGDISHLKVTPGFVDAVG